MIDVKKVEDFEKLTTALNGISTAIENMPTPTGAEVTGEASGTVATFNDGSANPLKSLVVDINPVQAGSGTPAPDNVRPISGWSNVEVTVSDDTTDPTTEETYEISLGQTVYGGKLNVTTGELTVDRAMVDLGTLTWGYSPADARFYNNSVDYKRPASAAEVANAICSQYVVTNLGTLNNGMMCLYTNGYIYIKDSRYTDATDFKTAMNGVQLVYELATPTTISLTPTQVSSLLGSNNIWADSGDSDVVYIRDINTAFNILWNAVMA